MRLMTPKVQVNRYVMDMLLMLKKVFLFRVKN